MAAEARSVTAVSHDLRRRVIAAYHEVTQITNAQVPYVFGGGHDSTFTASGGGYDCSGFSSRVLHVAGLLGVPHVPFPYDTHHFENWGNAGQGHLLTVWVVDSSAQDHMFLEFKLGSQYPLRFAQAAHSGTIVGWYNTQVGQHTGNPWIIDTTGFNSRHWPGA